MEKLNIDLSRFKKKSNIRSPEQDLADQIYSWSNKRLSFGMLMKYIKLNGLQRMYELWNEVRKGDAKDGPALLMWKLKK